MRLECKWSVITYLDTFVTAESIQLVQKFQHGMLDSTVTTLLGIETFRTNSVQLVNKDDGRGLLFGKFKGIVMQGSSKC